MPCLMDQTVNNQMGPFTWMFLCPLLPNLWPIKPQAPEHEDASMTSAQTSTSKKDGKCPCSPSPHPDTDENPGEWQKVLHKCKNPRRVEPSAYTSVPLPMSTPTVQAAPSPATPMVPAPITALPSIPITATALVPLPPNPSLYVAAPLPPQNNYTFPPDLEVTPTPQGGFPVPQIGASVWKNLRQSIKSS